MEDRGGEIRADKPLRRNVLEYARSSVPPSFQYTKARIKKTAENLCQNCQFLGERSKRRRIEAPARRRPNHYDDDGETTAKPRRNHGKTTVKPRRSPRLSIFVHF